MLRIVIALLSMGFFAGCSNLSYYSQAVGGHLEVMQAARPIDEVLADRGTGSELKVRLERVKEIRDFASRQLGLPDNQSYRSFADLGRPFVVWNVAATDELSLAPKTWCLVVVGCVSYRGFYDRAAAEQLAAELRQQGFDTHVGGVPAYSTLGYFNDPVLNTFLRFGEAEVARLIFHELTHQLVFVEGDTAFNESLATAVENEGVRRWFERHAAPAKVAAFEQQQRRKARFSGLVAGCRERLGALYASNLPSQEKRLTKARLLDELRHDYALAKAEWGGFDAYDKWFAEGLNNARIASLAAYSQLVPAFEAMLAEEGRDLPRFYRRAAALARLPKLERGARLAALMPLEPKVLALAVSPAR
jgi:predicted aminopeptidase